MSSSSPLDKWALITGCPNGFALSIAKALAAAEFNIFLHGRNGPELEKLCLLLRESYPGLSFVAVNLFVTCADDASLLVDYLSERLTHLRVVVHHLGGTLSIRSSMAPIDDWTKVLCHNCLFSFEINRLLIPYLKMHNYSRIINIGSVSATSLRGSAPYACSKALLNAYTKTLGRELAGSSIGVSCISLGAFETRNSNWMAYRKTDPSIISDFLSHHQAAARLGKPDEIIPVIKMILDPSFSFGQGAIIDYDGGTM
jgi:NAD(P)-dependent dehydrogenase (short-subunit alcohol dehydrogenase family)